jgi:hypothetical protein
MSETIFLLPTIMSETILQYNTIQYCPTSYNLLYVCPVLYQTTKCLKAKSNYHTTMNMMADIKITWNIYSSYRYNKHIHFCTLGPLVWKQVELSNLMTRIITKSVSFNPAQARCTRYNIIIAAGRLFSPGTPGSSTNKIDRYDITEILLNVALSILILTITSDFNKHFFVMNSYKHIHFCTLGPLVWKQVELSNLMTRIIVLKTQKDLSTTS